MTTIAVPLPGPVFLLPGAGLAEKLAEQAARPGVPQDPLRLIADLNARTEGAPVRVVSSRGVRGLKLRVHGPGYVAELTPSRHGDAFWLNGVYPMGRRDHGLLSGEGFLAVRPTAWSFVLKTSDVPSGADCGLSSIHEAWQKLAASRPAAKAAGMAASPHAEFLDTLDEVIDAVEKISVAKQADTDGFPYREIMATGGRRDGARSVYEFRLAGGDRAPAMHDYVQVGGTKQFRGQVTRLDGDAVTVRFEEPVAWTTLKPQGILHPTPNRTVYRRQRDAVERLRTNSVASAGLLGVVDGGRTRAFAPSKAAPADALDPEQLAAFQRALVVPDVLAVLGPPGTGKTRTIVEITRACVEATQRVLVTAHTHRAVDNVLARLPAGLVVLRLGKENRVTSEGLPFLLERQAADLKQEILGRTARRIEEHQPLATAQAWAPELFRRTSHLHQAVRKAASDAADHDKALRKAIKSGQKRRAKVTSRLAQLDQEVAERTTEAEDLAGRAQRSRMAFMAKRRQARADDLLESTGGLRQQITEFRAELSELIASETAAWRDDPSVSVAASAASRSRSACRESATEALEAARIVHAAVADIATDLGCPAPPGTAESAGAERQLTEFAAWVRRNLEVLQARSNLLAEWHEAVSQDSSQLHDELIRYADVIAATCSGTAELAELGDIQPDLAIIDEAGQLGLPDALVPLVRAKRAVLVGDDRQLPPFLDRDVKHWGQEAGERALQMLTRSALELLIGQLPPDNVVQLTRQRRMPAEICDFVSAQFYGGLLTTEGAQGVYRDPLFSRPMVLIGTGDLPERRRWEQRGGRSENWNITGRSNPAEAEVLAELAVLYHRLGAEWAVIVPYRAQVARVTDMIAKRIRNIELARNSVGTVDVFQGGERDVILYGFTCSNDRGDIGFLNELRRINVAVSRVRRQLVMVGDPGTLLKSRDTGFRTLAHALNAHVLQHGEVRDSQDVLRRARLQNDAEDGR